MEMRNGLEGLKSLLGISGVDAPQPRQMKNGSPAAGDVLAGDHATLSSAGAEALQAAGDSDVRTEKVTAVRSALAAGTYSVTAADVAGKMIDSMLAHGPSTE